MIKLTKTPAYATTVAFTHAALDTVDSYGVRDKIEHVLHPNVPVPSGVGFFAAGVFLLVRPLTSQDSHLLQEFLQEGLSDESKYLRFLSHSSHISSKAATYLASRDGRDRVALVAIDRTGGCEKIVGMVEYATCPNATAPPEVAVAVADAYQKQGIGKQLMKMLATLSIAGGHTQWTASLISDNHASRATLSHVGHTRVISRAYGVTEYMVELDLKRIYA